MLIDLVAMATFTSSPVKIHNWACALEISRD